MKARMKRLLAAGLVAVMSMSLIVGCGSDKKEESKKEFDGVLTVGFWGSSGEEDAIAEAVKGVEDEVEGVKEIKFEHYATVDDFFKKLPGQVAAGTAPDIVTVTNEQHIPLIQQGVFQPLDEYEFDLAGYAQNAIDAWTYDGKLYAVPFTSAPSTFAINTDMWKEAGLGDYPTTWEEVYEAAKALTKDGVAGLCLDIGNIYHPTQYMNSFGGGWKEGTAIDSEENIAGLEYIFKMFDEGLAVTAKDAGMTWDGEVFAGEKCAMSTGGAWYVATMRESAPDVNYTFVPMPGGNGKSGSTLHVYGAAVVNGAADTKIAAEVAYYMTRQEAQEKRAEIVGERPALEAALPAFRELNPNLNVIDEYDDQATSFGYPANPEFQTDFTTALENHIYNGDKTSAADILKTLAETYGE